MSPAPFLVAVGLLAQGALLAPLAGTRPAAGLTLVPGAALAAIVATAAWGRLAPPARASLAMLAAGGLGMTLGWWADVRWRGAGSVAREAAAWCGLARGDGVPGSSLSCWAMLAAGTLATRLAHGPRGARALAADALAMAIGTSAGAAWGSRAAVSLAPGPALVAAHAAMNAGMLAGMQALALARIARRSRFRLRTP